MSHADDAAAVLEQLVPLGDDHPRAQETHDAVARMLAERYEQARATGQPTMLLEATAPDATGVARPGDVLVLGWRETLTREDAERIRHELLARMPGLADVVFVPATVEAIYRGSQP